jgi:hypothetical protein
VHVPAFALEKAQVDVWVIALVLLDFARAYLESDGLSVRSILQMVSVADSGFESGTIARAKSLFSGVRDEHELALEDVYELILRGMPMPLAGPGAGRQSQEIHSEIGKSGGIPDSLAFAAGAWAVEGGRVARAGNRGYLWNIDSLCHAVPALAVCSMPRKAEFAVI